MAAMVMPKTKIALIPITALAFLQLGPSKTYLLAGEGQYLRVFEHQGRQSIHTECIFKSQAIHGIVRGNVAQDASNTGTLVIWGGRSICLVSIQVDVGVHGKPLVKICRHIPEILWVDWILDGCFLPSDTANSRSEANAIEALLVTAHDELLGLKFAAGVAGMRGNHQLYRIASGPSSILYSAHVLWADVGRRLLVAAGTVFGEVLLWSCNFDHSMSSEVHILYKFTGHEGSVFGVRISELTQNGDANRILASCSDDRTIRIWDISDTSGKEKAKELPEGQSNKHTIGSLAESSEANETGCLATIMGHAARIWGLRFLTQKDGCWDLISYGEDSTAQVWRVSSALDKGGTPPCYTYHLGHQTTYSYHSGKNLWAMTVFQEAGGDQVVATGGADGRIATYTPLQQGVSTQTAGWTSRYTMDEVSKPQQTTSSEINLALSDEKLSRTNGLFASFEGSWRLSRRLDSAISTYPSGTLEGIATFAKRPATDDSYEAEYLYSESGDFTTQQGLTMKATRQYVYRYSRSTDAISVWFVKPDDGSSVDYFFHKLDFRETRRGIDEDAPEACTASGYHLCVNDNYNASYSFQLSNSKLAQWDAVFDVDGPKKGYVAKATYTRDQAESEEPTHLTQPARVVDQATLNTPSKQDKPDAFKTYTWLGENDFLTTTEHGNLFVGTFNSHRGTAQSDDFANVVWEHVGYQQGLISSSIATSIPSLGIALLTGTDGIIYFYNHLRKQLVTISQLPGKANFLETHIVSEPRNHGSPFEDQKEMVGVFATCLGSSRATVFTFLPGLQGGGQSNGEDAGFSILHEYFLTLPSRFIVTSSCFLDFTKGIILGFRHGELAIYDLSRSTTSDSAVDVAPTFLPNVHGEDAITLIQVLPRNVSKLTSSPAIMTAGRDGKWAIHHILFRSENGNSIVTLKIIHAGMPPFGPNIEGACIDSATQDLLLWGFRSKHFIVWNESQKIEVMAVDCGGAHRHCAYIHNNQDGSSGGGGSFVYPKASVCHVHSQTRASHRVLQHGGHGREIKAMAVSPAIKFTDNDNDDDDDDNNDDNLIRLVATGAEDTNIRTFNLNSKKNLKCLSIITKQHTTGIQQLRWSSSSSSNGHLLLFSAAGCEEFFVWRFQPAPLVTVGVVCEAQCPPVTEEGDLRIMDFAIEEINAPPEHHFYERKEAAERQYLITNVYSDSSVRMFRYLSNPKSEHRQKSSFHLLSTGSYTTYCLTQATYLSSTPKNNTSRGLLCTASTDGHLAFWRLPPTSPSSSHLSQQETEIYASLTSTSPPHPHPTTMQWKTRLPIHQSSIKALISHPLPPSPSPSSSSEEETLIITGGDDGAIAFSRARTSSSTPTLDSSNPGSETATVEHDDAASLLLLFLPSAHASAVKGLVIFSNDNNENANDKNKVASLIKTEPTTTLKRLTLMSVGDDQRLKIWDVSIDIEAIMMDNKNRRRGEVGDRDTGIRVYNVADVYTAVADAGAMVGFCGGGDGDDEGGGKGEDEDDEVGDGDDDGVGDGDGGKRWVLLAGIGREMWRV